MFVCFERRESKAERKSKLSHIPTIKQLRKIQKIADLHLIR